jgi:ketosteroid isomerase-like protein
MSQKRVELLRRATDAFNRGDYAAATERAHPDVEYVPPGDQPPYRGVDQVRNWMQPDAFAKQRVELLDFEDAGDHLLVHAHTWVTGASSGIEMELDFWAVWTFDDADLVTRVQFFLDEHQALEAAGVSE